MGVFFLVSSGLGALLLVLGTVLKDDGLSYTAYCLWGIFAVMIIVSLCAPQCRTLFGNEPRTTSK